MSSRGHHLLGLAGRASFDRVEGGLGVGEVRGVDHPKMFFAEILPWRVAGFEYEPSYKRVPLAMLSL